MSEVVTMHRRAGETRLLTDEQYNGEDSPPRKTTEQAMRADAILASLEAARLAKLPTAGEVLTVEQTFRRARWALGQAVRGNRKGGAKSQSVKLPPETWDDLTAELVTYAWSDSAVPPKCGQCFGPARREVPIVDDLGTQVYVPRCYAHGFLPGSRMLGDAGPRDGDWPAERLLKRAKGLLADWRRAQREQVAVSPVADDELSDAPLAQVMARAELAATDETDYLPTADAESVKAAIDTLLASVDVGRAGKAVRLAVDADVGGASILQQRAQTGQSETAVCKSRSVGRKRLHDAVLEAGGIGALREVLAASGASTLDASERLWRTIRAHLAAQASRPDASAAVDPYVRAWLVTIPLATAARRERAKPPTMPRGIGHGQPHYPAPDLDAHADAQLAERAELAGAIMRYLRDGVLTMPTREQRSRGARDRYNGHGKRAWEAAR